MKIITAILAVILVSMFGFKAIAEVQNMNAMQTLSAKQRGIVPIAALIAIQEQRDGKAVERMEKVSDKQYHG